MDLDNLDNHLDHETTNGIIAISGTLLNDKTWILDSGVSDHLPNNQTTIPKHSGTMKLSDSLTLYNVLYIPNFKYKM
ncbi:hypothetical protein Lal_00010902 [Lupinus albus]|nr:hypothetical protein Lal_00010902 [Lupinus albus]